LRFFSQVGPFSYVVSAALMCLAALGAWQYKVNDAAHVHASRLAEMISTFEASPWGKKPPVVGCVTDMSTCRWAEDIAEDEGSVPRRPADVALFSQVAAGQKFNLDSGLVEITLSSGARVLLQGPAAFVVEPNGGLLSFGKVTAVFEKGGEAAKDAERLAAAKTATSASSATLASIDSDKAPFFIRTPTATIVDLGTEFGVDVDRNGRTASYVFRGAIRVRAAFRTSEVEDTTVTQGESVHVSPNGDGAPIITRSDVDPNQFLRHVNRRRVPIKLFNTGIGVESDKPDSHWEVVAASNDPDYKPRRAVVAKTALNWAPNDPKVSQWITAEPISPNNVTFTFRTTFQLPEGAAPETGTLFGWFAVDNHVQAIRLNGQKADVPEHEWDRYDCFRSFKIKQGFVEGENVLEFDVENIDPLKTYDVSRMGLRVELSGSVGKK
jgi:hypothetical protein